MKYEEYKGDGRRRRSAAQIESDVEQIRSEISQTMAQLEAKFSLGELVDRLINRTRHAGEGPSQFFKNLAATVRDHPVPILLLGTGVASLLMAERGSGRVEAGEPGAAEEARARFEEGKERVQAKAGALRERVQEGAREVRSRGGEMAREAKRRGGEMAREAKRRGREMVREHPLVLIGLGLALGAAMGAGAPISERERRLAGTVRQKAEERVGEVAEELREPFASPLEEEHEEEAPIEPIEPIEPLEPRH